MLGPSSSNYLDNFTPHEWSPNGNIWIFLHYRSLSIRRAVY